MKTSIIGVGHVGATLAYTLVLKGLTNELILVDQNQQKATSDAYDLIHSLAFTDHVMHIKAGEIEATENSDVIVLTLSVPWNPSYKTRNDLAPGNIKLYKQILPQLKQLSPDAVYVIVTNPVDVITYYAIKEVGLMPSKVLGIGTLIDSARFRKYLSDHKNIHPDDIRAYILGEHGESQFTALSISYAGGEHIKEEAEAAEAFINSSHSAYEIVKGKGYTNFGIAMATSLVMESIYLDNNRTVPISTLVDNFWGVSDVCLSIPAIIGRKGIVRTIVPDLNSNEIDLFTKSAGIVKDIIKKASQGN